MGRRRLERALRLRLAVLLYVGRRLGPPVAVLAIYAVAATLAVRWDLRRTGVDLPDFAVTLYGLFMQIFFEPYAQFPEPPLARALFWITPVVGVVLIAEGLLKVGESLFDPGKRTEVWTTIVSEQMRGHIVVCGLGHVGYRVLEELRRLGEDIVGIEASEKESFVEVVRAFGIAVHIGDARRDDLIQAAGIAHAKAIVCATGDDLANLEIALDAKRMNPAVRVVMRMFDQRLAAKVGGALELDQSFSTSALAAPLIAIQATQEGVHAAYRLDDIVRVSAEIRVGEKVEETTVAVLEQEAPCRVVSRRSGPGGFVAVRAGDPIRAADTLVVDVAALDLPAVRFRLGA